MKNNKLYYVLDYSTPDDREHWWDATYENKNDLIKAINICIRLNYTVNYFDVCVWVDGKLTPIEELKEFGGDM